ncbi:MAG: hypothetical protein ACI4MP_14025 [Candidatus Ventricola sp.]
MKKSTAGLRAGSFYALQESAKYVQRAPNDLMLQSCSEEGAGTVRKKEAVQQMLCSLFKL